MQNSSTPQLVRQIGLGSGIAVVVGSTIGSGIFRTPSSIAERLPGPFAILFVWLIAGLIVLCGALTLAEIGSAFPYSGGIYVFLREAYGRVLAFCFGWAQLSLIRPAAVGAVAIVSAQYALRLTSIPEDSPEFIRWTAILASAAILVVTVANVVGVKYGTRIQNLTTILKTVGLLVMVILAFALGLPKTGGNFQPFNPAGSLTTSALGLALVSVLWAYDGWADGMFVGGEMVDARKNIPRATVLGTAAVVVVYILTNLAYLAVLSPTEMAKSKGIAADLMFQLTGEGGKAFIIATVMISTFGVLNSTMLTSPRVFYALAEDRLFFPVFGKVHPTYRTPYVSILLCGALGILYVAVATAFTGSDAFSALTDAFVIALVPFYALAVGGVYLLRRRAAKVKVPEPVNDSLPDDAPRHHAHGYAPEAKTPLYPFTPAIFIAATGFLLVNSLTDPAARQPTIITLGCAALGVPVYYGVVRRWVQGNR